MRHYRWFLGAALALLSAVQVRAEPAPDLALLQAGSLKVAVYSDFGPWSDKVGGAMKGIDVELAKALAAHLKLQLSLMPFDAGEGMDDDLRNMVWKGHYLGYGPADVMLHVPVDKRFMAANDKALIIAPYYRETVVFVYDREKIPEPKMPDDLIGQPLAAERGTGNGAALLGAAGGALRDKVKIADSGAQAVRMVIDGKVTGALVTRAQAEAEIKAAGANPGRFVLAEVPFAGVPPGGWVIGLAVKADHKVLAEALDHAIEEMRASGELERMFAADGLRMVTP